MFRSAVGKIVWMARATTVVVGLAIMLAMVFGVASVAFGNDGDFFKIGFPNIAQSTSTLDKSGAGPALDLQVDSGPALKVNSAARVAKLNADRLDNLDSTALGVTTRTSEQLTGECDTPNVPNECAIVEVRVPAGKKYHVTVFSSFTAASDSTTTLRYCPRVEGGNIEIAGCLDVCCQVQAHTSLTLP